MRDDPRPSPTDADDQDAVDHAAPARWDFDDIPADDRDVPTRRPWLLVAAAIPWLVLAVVMLRGGPSAGTEPATTVAPTSASPTEKPQPTVTASPEPMPSPSAQDAASFPRDEAAIGDATALAVPIARAWLTGVGPGLDLGVGHAGGSTYVEHLGVEAVDLPAPGHIVVSLIAVVLESDGTDYTGARVRRLAVPLQLGTDGARPAGTPWWLPDPDLRPATADRQPVTDPELLAEATTALERAGYRGVTVTALARTEGWPWVATATAAAPGASAEAEHEVWLRPQSGRLVVAGWLPTSTDSSRTPDEPPSDQDIPSGSPPADGPSAGGDTRSEPEDDR